MILSCKFCVQLGCFLIVFLEPSSPNKIVLGQFIHCLYRFGVKELTAGNNINIVLILKRYFFLCIKLLLKVFVIWIWTPELVCINICLFNNRQIIWESGCAVFLSSQPLPVHIGQDQWGALMSKHGAEEQIMLYRKEPLVFQVIQKF